MSTADRTETRPRVAIVGAGFGGLQVARELVDEPVDVVLVDRANYHLFLPLLYQVASSLLDPSDIAMPVRAIFHDARNIRFRMAEVVGLDFDACELRTAEGETIPYDYVVIAAGSRTDFFGMESVEHVAIGLNDLPDAVALRNRILTCFETATGIHDTAERAPWLTFVVAGGGATGVEYAGALSELLRLVLVDDYPELDVGEEARVILLEATDRLLRVFPEELGEYAVRELEGRGVEVRLDTAVTGASEGRVRLQGGAEIPTRTLVWAAGVVPVELAAALEVERGEAGRIVVDPDLRIPGREGAFAIGDVAAVVHEGAVLPMMAPPAMQEGRHAARNVLRLVRGEPTERFEYHDKGMMATIGRSDGIAAKGGLVLTGFLGWIAWLVIHLYYLIGFRNRLSVLSSWILDYLRYDRPIRIIAREKRPF